MMAGTCRWCYMKKNQSESIWQSIRSVKFKVSEGYYRIVLSG